MKRGVVRNLVIRTRSFRKFYHEKKICRKLLRELVDLARLSASGGNVQPLKYILSCTRERNKAVFSCLAWAGNLADWTRPAEDERPSAYIVILGDTTIRKEFKWDSGIAAQSIMLGATEHGLGGCIIGSVDRKRLRKALKIPQRYEIVLVLALGRPKEKVRLEPVKRGNIKYWRDAKGMHHVPKRSLDEIILKPK